MENDENKDLEQDDVSKIDLEVSAGDGSELEISEVFEHLNCAKKKLKKDKKKIIKPKKKKD